MKLLSKLTDSLLRPSYTFGYGMILLKISKNMFIIFQRIPYPYPLQLSFSKYTIF